MTTSFETFTVDGREIKLTNPDKVFWPASGHTKRDLLEYYLSVMEGFLGASWMRPSTMYRWPNGVQAPEDSFFQKRVPKHAPEWLETAVVTYPSGRSADMPVLADGAHVAWLVNLGCIDFNPWPVRAEDVDHPDELRVDLDPTEGVPWSDVLAVAPVVRDVLTEGVPWSDVLAVAPVVRDVLKEHGLVGWSKTSGKRGLHVYVPVRPSSGFTTVRRAALALAREVERRMDGIATTAWWKEERRGVFVDYNQNARDRTIAAGYSVRPVQDARVSMPVSWDEIDSLDPGAFTLTTVPARFGERGDAWAGMEDSYGDLASLLDLAAADESGGVSDAPWPPHFPKADKEPPRVAPSRARKRAR